MNEVEPTRSPARPSRWRQLTRRLNGLFLLTVFLPTLFAGLYYGLVASDVYVSESRFLVRSPQRSVPTGLGALLQGTGLGGTQDNTYAVHDYVLSRDALRELEEQLGLREMYTAQGIDVLSRFPSLSWWDKSFEAFHRYYQNQVTVEYDTVSSISLLEVRAFTAQDAQAINDLLLTMGERLVNQLNERSRRDLVEVAQKEVQAAENRSKAATVAVSGFRTQQGVYEPDRQAGIQLQGVAKLQDELITTEGQLAQVRQLSPRNPQIGALENRVRTLNRAMAEESAKVTGGGPSFTSKSAGFDRLLLEKTFADRQLAVALASLEQARNEAHRQQLYLERLVQAHVPDDAVEPQRVRTVLTVFIMGLILWGVLSLVVASVKEHTE
ncbi:MAG: hypothetical protein H0U56_09835 [Methylibium sp.]|nr:hypothetical protein [Methylibium sp.]